MSPSSILLNSERIQTGVGIAGDCTGLKEALPSGSTEWVNRVKLALAWNVALGPERELADLCSHLLRRHVCKDASLSISARTAKKLTNDQEG